MLIADFEKVIKSVYQFEMQFKCEKIENIEFFSKSDPFLRFYKHKNPATKISDNIPVQDSNWLMVHQTEFYKDNLNPKFNKIFIPD